MVEGKVKFALWIAPETRQIVADIYKEDNCKSMSEFIEKAVLFYNGYLHARRAEYYLPRVLGSILQGTLGMFGDRIGKLLFKQAVECNIANHILAADTDMDKEISIKELCLKAGVSRQAFYRNFSSLDEVMEEKLGIISREITAGLTGDIHQNWIHIFMAVEKDMDGIRTLLKADMEHVILKYMNYYLPVGEKERKLQVVWNGVIYNLIIDWAVNKKPASYLEMAELAYQMTKEIPPVEQFVEFPFAQR